MTRPRCGHSGKAERHMWISRRKNRQLTDNAYSGVAVGSSIGHAIGGMFGGGGSSEPAQASPQATQQPQNDQWGPNCSLATKSFTNCMDEHQGNMSICGWYMEQLKACQAAASQY